MGLLSAGWTSVGLSHLLTPPGSTSGVLGVLLLGIGGMLLLSTASVGMGKTVVAAAIGLAGARYVLTGVYQLSANGTWQDISGIVGLVVTGVAGVAAYAATALELEDARDATVLPVGRRGPGRVSLHAPLADQLDGVEHEPGVRRPALTGRPRFDGVRPLGYLERPHMPSTRRHTKPKTTFTVKPWTSGCPRAGRQPKRDSLSGA